MEEPEKLAAFRKTKKRKHAPTKVNWDEVFADTDADAKDEVVEFGPSYQAQQLVGGAAFHSVVDAEEEDDKMLYERLKMQKRRMVPEATAGLQDVRWVKVEEIDESVLAEGTTSVNPLMKKEEEELGDGTVSITRTSEFCKSLLTPLEKIEQEQSSRRFELKREDGRASRAPPAEGQDPDDMSDEDRDAEEELEDLLEDDPLDNTISSALAALRASGDIDSDGWRMGRHRRDNAPLHTSTHDGEIKLEYKDHYGRVMTPKEAFRHQSWIFHGKGPGKRKKEKLLEKMEQERRQKTRNLSSDSQVLQALKKQQERTGQAHIHLQHDPNAA